MDACQSTGQSNPSENDKGYLLDALKTLYHLAYFDRPRYYIPGETATQSRNRQKFAVCGGLLALIYIYSRSSIPEVKEFCETKKMNDIEPKDLDLASYVIQLYLEKKGFTLEKKQEVTPAKPNPDANVAQNTMFIRYGLIEQIDKNDIVFSE